MLLVLDRALERLYRRIEALDMAGHQRNAGAVRGGNDGVALLDGRGDRLFHQHVNAASGAFERDLAMKMSWRGNGDGFHAQPDQGFEIGQRRAAERTGNLFALLGVGVDNTNERNPGHVGQDAGMVGPHDADPDHADPQAAVRA